MTTNRKRLNTGAQHSGEMKRSSATTNSERLKTGVRHSRGRSATDHRAKTAEKPRRIDGRAPAASTVATTSAVATTAAVAAVLGRVTWVTSCP